MSKYYTPEKEEIFIGFEFDWQNKHDKGWNTVKWDMNQPMTMYQLIYEINSGRIRVKHLDREDIESLGWSYSLTFSKEGVYDEYSKTDGEHGDYYLRVHNTGGLSIGEHWVQLDVFKGTIKNKSELKRILKQLGI